MRKACFFDRDGVLIAEANYIKDPDQVRILPGAAEALRLVHAAGFLAIVVSNQSGIARGYFTEVELDAVEERMKRLLAEQGASVDGIYHCFHHPTKGTVPEYVCDCDCRKPKPGMLLAAACDFQLDLSQSVIVGDKTSDVEAGINAGCRAAALVRTGHGAEQNLSPYPGVVDAPDVLTATRLLLSKVSERSDS